MKRENIEDIVALLPMQQSFLWHSLQVDAAASVLQLRCTFHGNISIEQLKKAWVMVVRKHQALRSSVHWEKVKKPIQVVHKRVASDILLIQSSSPSGYDDGLDQYLEDDRKKQLDLTKAPAYRIALCQTQDDSYELIWTLSHVLLDGWSCAVVISDWARIYSDLALENEASTTSGPLLREHTRWIGHQDQQATLDFWDNYLPPRIQLCAEVFQPPENATAGSSLMGSCQANLSPQEFGLLQQALRQAGLSLGTLLQAAYATVLHARGSEVPVVFGSTVSGRQIDLPHTELRVGMLINLIPICVAFDQDLSIHQWLTTLQAEFFSALPHAHASMTDLLSLRPGQSALYDSLLVLENQPQVLSTPELEVSDLHSGIISEFALTLVAIPGSELQLNLTYREDTFMRAEMEALLRQFETLLLKIPLSFDQPVSWLSQYKHVNNAMKVDFPGHDMSTVADASAAEEHDELVKTVLERKLGEIWCEILNGKQLTVNDSFFDLGGTSIQAMMLFDQIEKLLGIRLAPTTLFRAPTIEDIATLIETNQPVSAWSNIVGINESGTTTPIFIPFEQADMLGYGPLCAELGVDQPVYGLKVPVDAPATDELLETLVNHIKTLQPVGPYQLVGLSGAGILAWRIAQKLQAQGNVVSMLTLLDSYGPAYPRLLPPFARLKQVSIYVFRELAAKVRNRLGSIASGLMTSGASSSHSKQGTGAQPAFNEQEFRDFKQRVAEEQALAPRFLSETSQHQSFFERTINRTILAITSWRVHSNKIRVAYIMFLQALLIEWGIRTPESNGGSTVYEEDPLELLKSASDSLIEDLPATRKDLERYLSTYDGLQKYDGKLVFFRAIQRPPGIVDDPLSGWRFLFPEDARIHAVPGSHRSMLRQPNVHALANHLMREMEIAEPPEPGSDLSE